jgi:hypothetical protein
MRRSSARPPLPQEAVSGRLFGKRWLGATPAAVDRIQFFALPVMQLFVILTNSFCGPSAPGPTGTRDIPSRSAPAGDGTDCADTWNQRGPARLCVHMLKGYGHGRDGAMVRLVGGGRAARVRGDRRLGARIGLTRPPASTAAEGRPGGEAGPERGGDARLLKAGRASLGRPARPP